MGFEELVLLRFVGIQRKGLDHCSFEFKFLQLEWNCDDQYVRKMYVTQYVRNTAHGNPSTSVI